MRLDGFLDPSVPVHDVEAAVRARYQHDVRDFADVRRPREPFHVRWEELLRQLDGLHDFVVRDAPT